MNALNIVRQRLHNQQIAAPFGKQPSEVVARLGAIQAQDFAGAKWSVGLRLTGATDADIEQALADRTIIRTWPMRGTLHFVAAADVRWMLALLTPRIIAGSARRQQQLELDAKVFARCEKLFVQALQGGKQLSRDDMYGLLETGRISTAGQRGYHILWRLAQEKLICFGARDGKQQTFALLDEWAPQAKSLEGEAALAELTKRYFIGHGPATVQDFVWWSGLKVSDAKMGLEMVGLQLAQEKIDGKVYWTSQEGVDLPEASSAVYLLPGFDEYMLGYRDRSAALDLKYAERICPGSNGMFSATIVMDGRVVGTWRRTFKKDTVVITVSAFKSFNKEQKKAIADYAERYAKFLGMAKVVIS
ncbi:MAG: hypothetical protein JWQ71_1840 [Pedosphaera sp.]|nr:hypothetical protein [Pedosphaera sp.]